MTNQELEARIAKDLEGYVDSAFFHTLNSSMGMATWSIDKLDRAKKAAKFDLGSDIVNVLVKKATDKARAKYYKS